MNLRITRRLLVVFLILIVTALSVYSMPPKSRTSPMSTDAAQIDRTTYIDANNILMFVTNEGIIGRDLADLFGYDYGTFYPYTGVASILDGSQTESPLYSAGLWLGGMVNGGIRVALAEYSSEYWPGPMVNHTFVAGANTDPAYRVYKLYADSGVSNPNTDYREWPVDQGAPTDQYGNPLIMGAQSMWAVFNDANPDQHWVSSGETEPLGIEVQQYCWASASAGAAQNLIYYHYKLYNKGYNYISNFYIGIFVDPDLGGSADDLCGVDTANQIGYCYNSTNSDDDYGSTPPAIGVRVLYGPLVLTINQTGRFFDQDVPSHRNLNMSSFYVYTNGGDPNDAGETYNCLQGLLPSGASQISNQTGLPTKFARTGDPVRGTGDLDYAPADRRFVASFGPLDFNPGDSQYVAFVIGVGRGGDRLSSITVMKYNLEHLTDLPTDVGDAGAGSELPSEYLLGQNYPNPFNPSTMISYDLPSRSDVRIDVYNVLGQNVRTLLTGVQAAGRHTVEWNGQDANGRSVASGVYLYRLQAGDFMQTRKMVLAK